MSDNEKCPKCGMPLGTHSAHERPLCPSCQRASQVRVTHHSAVSAEKYAELERQLAAKTRECEDLAAWKESAMAVEAKWAVQAVGKAIDVPWGGDVRSAVLPAIEKLQRELAASQREAADALAENLSIRRQCEGTAAECDGLREAVVAAMGMVEDRGTLAAQLTAANANYRVCISMLAAGELDLHVHKDGTWYYAMQACGLSEKGGMYEHPADAALAALNEIERSKT